MKYANIVALVPPGEHFDADTFVMNEAAWISSTHLCAIDAALGANNQQITSLQDAATAADKRIADLDVSLAAANNATAAANKTITDLNDKITAMGKLAAGGFSNTTKPTADAIPGAPDPAGKYMTSVDAEKQRLNAQWTPQHV